MMISTLPTTKSCGHFINNHKIPLYYECNFMLDSFDITRPLVLFNYGIVSNNELWRELLHDLDHHNYQTLIHDYRCHHQSGGKDAISLLTIPNIVEDLSELINFVGAKKIIIIAHSMGGSISLEFTNKYQEKVLAMVLISATIMPPKNTVFDSILMDWGVRILLFFNKLAPSLLAYSWKNAYRLPIIVSFLHRIGFNTSRVPYARAKTFVQRVGELSPLIFTTLYSEMNQLKISKYLRKLKMPTLIIGGAKDCIVPIYLQHLLKARLPHAKLLIHPEGSHVPNNDFPELVNSEIISFLNKLR